MKTRQNSEINVFTNFAYFPFQNVNIQSFTVAVGRSDVQMFLIMCYILKQRNHVYSFSYSFTGKI